MEGFAPGGAVARHEPAAQRIHAAAQVADAHGAGKGVAVHLAEGLHLHRAGKRDQRVGHQIPLLREEADHEQHHDLAQHHQLPPVEPLHLLEFLAQQFRREHAQRKEAQRHQIVQHRTPVALDQLHAAQHDVAGLCIGKHLAAIQIGINVLQAAGDRQEHGGAERFGHLPIVGQFSTDGHGMVPPLHKFPSMIAHFGGFVKILAAFLADSTM